MTTKAWEEHQGVVLAAVNAFDVIDCATCRFAHAIPVPSEAELHAFYESRFYEKKADYFALHKRDEAWWTLQNQPRYERYEQILGGPGSILDVGCGPGFFLKLGADRGWKVCGIEPSAAATEYARSMGLDVVTDALRREHVRSLGAFDVVHSAWVLEHVRDAREFLRTCAALVKPAGLVTIGVANDFNPLQKLLVEQHGYQPWWAVPPEHLNYFTRLSLGHLFESVGLEVVHTTGSFPMELFLLMGDNYIGDRDSGRAAHERRMRLEFALASSGLAPALDRFYEALAREGFGRHIIMTARKSKEWTL